MPRPRWLSVLALALLFGITGIALAQDVKKETEPKKEPGATPRLRGQVPPNFRNLGLTDEQKQRIYKIQSDFDQRLADLEAQIKRLKTEEKVAIEKVLSDAQRARLKEILNEKSGTVEEKKPDDKKSAETTPDKKN